MCKTKAYKVSCRDDDHGARVVLAANGKSLRGARPSDGCDCDYVELRVVRAPQFDKYAPGPITTRHYLEQGWFQWCCQCEDQVYGDSDGIVVDATGHVFCSRECMQAMLDSYGEWNPETMHESCRIFIQAVQECLASLPAVEASASISEHLESTEQP